MGSRAEYCIIPATIFKPILGNIMNPTHKSFHLQLIAALSDKTRQEASDLLGTKFGGEHKYCAPADEPSWNTVNDGARFVATIPKL